MRDLPLSRWIARGQTCSNMHIPLRSCWGGIWFQRKDRLQPCSRSYLPLGSNRNMRTAHGPSVCNFWVSTDCFGTHTHVFFPGWACWAIPGKLWLLHARCLICLWSGMKKSAAADKMLRAAPCICEFFGTPKNVQQPQEWSIQFWFLAKLHCRGGRIFGSFAPSLLGHWSGGQ